MAPRSAIIPNSLVLHYGNRRIAIRKPASYAALCAKVFDLFEEVVHPSNANASSSLTSTSKVVTSSKRSRPFEHDAIRFYAYEEDARTSSGTYSDDLTSERSDQPRKRRRSQLDGDDERRDVGSAEADDAESVRGDDHPIESRLEISEDLYDCLPDGYTMVVGLANLSTPTPIGTALDKDHSSTTAAQPAGSSRGQKSSSMRQDRLESAVDQNRSKRVRLESAELSPQQTSSESLTVQSDMPDRNRSSGSWRHKSTVSPSPDSSIANPLASQSKRPPLHLPSALSELRNAFTQAAALTEQQPKSQASSVRAAAKSALVVPAGGAVTDATKRPADGVEVDVATSGETLSRRVTDGIKMAIGQGRGDDNHGKDASEIEEGKDDESKNDGSSDDSNDEAGDTSEDKTGNSESDGHDPVDCMDYCSCEDCHEAVDFDSPETYKVLRFGFYDKIDKVRRCVMCGWEIVAATCQGCRRQYEIDRNTNPGDIPPCPECGDPITEFDGSLTSKHELSHELNCASCDWFYDQDVGDDKEQYPEFCELFEDHSDSTDLEEEYEPSFVDDSEEITHTADPVSEDQPDYHTIKSDTAEGPDASVVLGTDYSNDEQLHGALASVSVLSSVASSRDDSDADSETAEELYETMMGPRPYAGKSLSLAVSVPTTHAESGKPPASEAEVEAVDSDSDSDSKPTQSYPRSADRLAAWLSLKRALDTPPAAGAGTEGDHHDAATAADPMYAERVEAELAARVQNSLLEQEGITPPAATPEDDPAALAQASVDDLRLDALFRELCEGSEAVEDDFKTAGHTPPPPDFFRPRASSSG